MCNIYSYKHVHQGIWPIYLTNDCLEHIIHDTILVDSSRSSSLIWVGINRTQRKETETAQMELCCEQESVESDTLEKETVVSLVIGQIFFRGPCCHSEQY